MKQKFKYIVEIECDDYFWGNGKKFLSECGDHFDDIQVTSVIEYVEPSDTEFKPDRP